MDSMLVVMYSETGHARRVALQLCSEHGWPVGEVRDLNAGEGYGLVRTVLEALPLRRAHIAYEGPDPAHFRTVVLVTPMRGGHVPAPMRAFLQGHCERLRRTAIVSILKSEDAASAVAEVARVLGHAPIHNVTVTAAEIDDGSGAASIAAFGDFLQPRSVAEQSGQEALPAGAR
jgi:hypothetical protein